MKRLAIVALAVLLAGCGVQGFFERFFGRSGPKTPTYLVGEPYAIGGVWHYPHEDFAFNETGLTSIAGAHAARTANGEAYEATAFAAGHRTLPLPSVVRVTNLENGRQMLLRLNDRGPEKIGRLLELTPRAAQLLGVGNPDATKVRVEILEAESRALAAELQGNQPIVSAIVAAAPKAGVQSEALAPPPGANAGAGRSAAPARAVVAASPITAGLQQIDGSVRQGSARNAALTIECGSFGRRDYADILRNRLASFGARLETDYNAPRDRAIFVRVGHFTTVAEADAMLTRLLGAGIAGAHIVVE